MIQKKKKKSQFKIVHKVNEQISFDLQTDFKNLAVTISLHWYTGYWSPQMLCLFWLFI